MTEYAKLVLAVDSTQAKGAQGDLDGLTESGKKTEGQLANLKSVAAAAGVAIAAAATAVVAMTKANIDAADAAGESAAAAGISVENYTRLGYAMKFSVGGADALDGSMKFLNKSMYDAANGSKSAQTAFDSLGVSYKNADGSLRESTDVLLDVADKFSTMKDGAQKSAMAMDIFGKSGADMVPFLNQGREGITALTDQADRLGVTLTGDVANAAGQFNDNIDVLKGAAKGFGNEIMKGLLPSLNNLGNEFVATADNGDQMKGAADGVVAILKGVVTVGVTASATLQAIGNGIGGIAAATVAALSGDFKGAADIMRQVYDDTVNVASNTMSRIDAIWSASASTVEAAEERKRTAVHATMAAVGGDTSAAPGGIKNAATAAAPAAAPVVGPTEEDLTAWLEREDAAQAQVNSMKDWYRQQDIAAEEAASQSRIQMAQYEADARRSAMDGMFSNLISLMSSRSKTMFNIGKAAAITQTVLSTYEGAQKAYASLAGIPIVGPALGIAAAGAAIAAGAARVSAIRSQSFGGGSVSNVGGGGGVSSGGGFSGSTGGGGLIAQQPLKQTTDIRLTGIKPDDMITGSYLQKIIEGIGETLADNGGRMGRVELVTT
jgi:hypothetical protein